jgi:multimeric flavodoxin WrbA
MQSMLEAVLDGTKADGIEGIAVEVRAALAATATDVLAADGFILGTSANIGYMSGALKHFFDTIYYPCLQAKIGAGYGLYVHGNSDTTGAVRAIEAITKGLSWQPAHTPVLVIDKPVKDDLDACWDLGATLAASLMPA